jgi:sirohydrochlorin ferrochelatase
VCVLKQTDEIICHPYFLSPGRHVREDIPQIIEEAIASLQIEIPVITTDPLGSNTQLMLGAIHSLVRENSQLLKKSKTPEIEMK